MSLTKNNSYNITSLNDNSKTQAAGKGLALAGGAGIGVYILAALLPFVGVLGTSGLLLLAGVIFLLKR